MNRSTCAVPTFALVISAQLLAAQLFTAQLCAQSNAPAPSTPESTLHINSRAVLVDVLVTDRNGNPIKGLKQDAFSVTEQGKPQTISFFEEHTAATVAQPQEMPKLPPNVFTNFSPFPAPPAVNVLLLDSLNTPTQSQIFVHQQAMKFLKTAKPGTRTAIFTMALGLHFVQGFTDDPALLVAALGNNKNNEIQNSVMIKSQSETNAQANVIGMMSTPEGGYGGSAAPPGMIAALQQFIGENDDSRGIDRVMVTLANFQRLATFLNGFPGRKNVIWFSESFPLVISGNVDPQLRDEFAKTMAILAAARVAVYPVDARGVMTTGFYQAGNQLPSSTSAPYQIIGTDSTAAGKSGAGNSPGAQVGMIQQEDVERNTEQYTMESIAHETGGKAFLSNNGLSQVIAEIAASSADFYTLSYAPTNPKMDGLYRKIDVKVAGGHYNLSFRRGYTATDAALPGAAPALRNQALQKYASQNPGHADPLLPFMDLGMPQSEQILFKILVKPAPEKEAPVATDQPPAKGLQTRYIVDFAIDLNDLDLKLDSDGMHKGVLNISLVAYDRYGHIATRKDTEANVALKPDVWDIYQKTGMLLHAELLVPKGQLWLRTGIYDQTSHKVGTLEVPLTSVTVAKKE